MADTMQGVQEHERGVKLFGEPRLEDAIQALERALNREATSERWNDWACVQLARGQSKDAEHGYRRALQLDPGDLLAATNLGVLLARSGRPEEAIPFLERGAAGIDEQQKATILKLLAQCRASVAGEPGLSLSVDRESQHILKSPLLQTTALNNLALRVIALYDGFWEPNIHKLFISLVKQGDTVMDVGANFGFYTLVAAEAVGRDGKVYAIEAGANNFNILKRNIHINGFENRARAFHNAALDKRQPIELLQQSNVAGGHSVFVSEPNSPKYNRAPVDGVLIDELIPTGTVATWAARLDV
jgi:FkbM family methyltransferase